MRSDKAKAKIEENKILLALRGQLIINLKFDRGLTRKEIAYMFHITTERVRQIEHKAFRNLKIKEVR